MQRGIKYRKKTLKYFDKKIADLEAQGCRWERDETRAKMIESCEKYFDSEIRDVPWRQRSKDWHKNTKKFCNYNSKTGLLNLKHGPIADLEDVKRYEKKEI